MIIYIVRLNYHTWLEK